MKKRDFLKYLLLMPLGAFGGSFFRKIGMKNSSSKNLIKKKMPLGLHWEVQDPFLFCAHHNDEYPAGNEKLGLDAKHFNGRNMGSDFELKDGFRLYHGREIPGFPVHPHRGFETVTIVRKGYADHADSLGASGRYGEGDVQWMTAGSGIQHSEMFPLIHKDKKNTLELFQIWLNLPKANKMVKPDFKMLWANEIPKIQKDKLEVSIISGEYEKTKYFQAPKNSWANDPANQVNIFLVKIKEGGVFNYPAKKDLSRSIYVFEGDKLKLNGEEQEGQFGYLLDESIALNIEAQSDLEILLLEARPISEPVVQHGPFVMNSREEIIKTFEDYNTTRFGGWKWEREDMIHAEGTQRFAKYPDGRVVKPKLS